MLAGKISGKSYDAIIEVDDILKYSEADCRQQSLVMMEVLRNKGYPVRSISLKDSLYGGGHYTFEAYYNRDWHFFDPDAEPNNDLLLRRNRPSIAKLTKDPAFLTSIYPMFPPSHVIRVWSNFKYGKINEMIPNHLYIFHNVTKFLSSSLWVLLLIIYVFRYRLRRTFFHSRMPSPLMPHKSLGQAFNSLFL
jgi:hypothetical protein